MAPFYLAKIDRIVEDYGRNYTQAHKVLKKEDKKTPNDFIKIACADVLSRNGQFDEADAILTKLLETRPVTSDAEYLRRLYNLSALIKKRQGLAYYGSTAALLEYFRAAELLFNKSSSKFRLHRPFEVFFQSAFAQVAWKDLVAACRELKKVRNDIDIHVLSVALCSKASLYCKSETFYAAATSRGAANEATKIVENTLAGKDGPILTNVVQIITIISLWRSHDMKDKTREFVELAKNPIMDKMMGPDSANYHSVMQDELHRFGDWKLLFDLLDGWVTFPIKLKMDRPHTDIRRITDAPKLWASWFVSAEQLFKEGDEKAMERLDILLKQLEGSYAKPAKVPCDPHLTRIKIAQFRAPENTVKHCVDHFDMFGHSMQILEDLAPILSSSDRLPFIEKIKEKTIVEGVDYFKRVVALYLEFAFVIEPTRPSPEAMEEFIVRCLKLGYSGHNKARTKFLMGTRSAFFLAAMCILMLQDEKQYVRRTQAAYLLAWVFDSGPKQSSHSGAKILLLKTLMSLGIGNTAFGYWPAVKAKKILQDAISHNLLARASTQIPFGVPNSKMLADTHARRDTIEEELRAQLNFFEKDYAKFITARGRSLQPWSSITQQNTTEQTTLPKDPDNGTLAMIIQRLEVKFALEHSFARALLRLELHRTLRMKGARSTENDYTLGPFHLLVDSRDTTSISDIKYPETSERNVDVVGNRYPGVAYLANFLLVEHTQSLIYGDRPLVADCEEIQSVIQSNGEKLKHEAYEVELQALEIWALVRQVVLKTLSSEDATGLKEVWELLLTALVTNTLSSKHDDRFFGKPLVRKIDAHSLNTVFMNVEMLLTLRKLCVKLRDVVKDPKHKASHQLKPVDVNNLSSHVEAAIGYVFHFATLWKGESRIRTLTESYRQCMREDEIGKRVWWAARLSDSWEGDNLAQIFATSAAASIDGILKAVGKG